MFNRAVLFILSSVAAAIAAATPLSPQKLTNEADRAAYRALLNDFAEELSGFDAVKEPATELQMFLAGFKRFAETGGALPTTALDLNKTWGPSLNAPGTIVLPAELSPLTPIRATVDTRDDHAIKDLKAYISQRIGSEAARLTSSGALRTIVVGGRVEALGHLDGLKSAPVHPLPSPYQAWGLYKYFVAGEGTRPPTLIIQVPPGKEYLEHYAGMLSALGVSHPEVYKDVVGHQIYQRKLTASLEGLMSKLKTKPDVVILGYTNQWKDLESTLKKSSVRAEVSSEVHGEMGLSAQTLRVVDTAGGDYTSLLVRSDLTIWGELSSMIVKSALETVHPSAIVFMGSAGALNPKTSVYDLSAPAEFYRQNRKIPVSNFLNPDHRVADAKVDFSWPLWKNLWHGHTYSPVEQTASYVSHQSQKIGTLDVEVDLIAEEVASFNLKTRTQVELGVINVITDKPSAHLTGEETHDLTQIDVRKKAQARIEAVRWTHERLLKLTSGRLKRACSRIFLEN